MSEPVVGKGKGAGKGVRKGGKGKGGGGGEVGAAPPVIDVWWLFSLGGDKRVCLYSLKTLRFLGSFGPHESQVWWERQRVGF